MVTTVKGAKAGQKAPRKPVIQKDSVASISTVKILYGLSEGEIEGLANGAASIRLDDTPLVDANGNKNFDNVTWDFRAGTNDQEYIKGFPDVSNETAVGVELRSAMPWIKAFTDTQLSAVRVRFAWNGLRKTNADNGDVTGYRIDYAIDLQTDGGAYQNVLTTKIEDKTSGGYERTHRIDLPKAKTGWQIRVRRLTPNSDSDLIADKMMVAAVTEVIDVKLRYPNTALLGIQYDAETFSNIAKIAVRLKGKRIRVPSNYDPAARTYTGIWDGTFKIAYSNNPAWVYFDLCTQWRYGIGNYIDASMIDKWSLYTLGQYCDQKVSDGKGGLEPRFVCNVYLQSKADAYQVLSNIAGIFRAMSYWNGERIVLDADVPQDPVYTFSRANVVDGNFEYTGTRQRDRHTLVKVAWDNPANDFKTEYEYVRDERAIAKFGVKVLDLSAFGCTSQAQAQRAGLWALKTEQLETRQVSFSAGLDGFIPQVGNIINVSDELFAGRANGGRVAAVSDAQYVITIDRDAIINIGDILIVNGGNGKSERRTVRLVNGRKITVNAPFTAAEAQHIWAVEAPDLKLMRFRVMSINQGDDSKFNITAIQHEPQKYDAIDFGVDVKPTDITIINPDVIDAPTNVAITSRHRIVQGQTVTTLVITWGQVKGAVAYDVEWRKDEGTWIKLRRIGNISVEIDGVYSGNYIAKVRAVSALDVLSAPAWSVSTEVKGKAGLPPSIVGLRATGILFGMQLNWGFGVGSGDAAYTEIEVASAPDVNVALLGQFSYPTDTHTINGLQGNLPQSYRARLVDKLGFKSAWTPWVTGTTDASADKVLDLISGQISETQLATDLSTKIDKIDVNTKDIVAANNKITAEAQARVDAITGVNTAINAESQARIDAIFNTDAKINTEIADRTAAIKTVNTAISAETQARVNGLTGVNARVDTTDAKVVQVESQLTNDIGAQAERIDLIKADYKPKYLDKNRYLSSSASQWTYAKSVARDNYATNERITVLRADVADSNAQITKSLETLVTKDEAFARDLTAIDAKTGQNAAAINSESQARTAADSALSTRLDTAQAATASNSAAIQSEVTARTNADNALSGRIDTVVAKSVDNEAAVVAERQARTTAIGALATDVTALQAQTGQNKAAIASEVTARTSADTALSGRIDTLKTDVDGNKAAITAEITARSQADSALTSRIDAMGVEVGNNKSAITSEAKTRADADTAMGLRVDTVVAKTADNTAAIATEVTARTNADTAITQSITTMGAKVADNKAAIDSEVTARANADTALSTRIDTVTAESANNKAAITAEATARTTADGALSTRIDAVTAKSGANESAIASEIVARTSADSALGTRIDAVSAKTDSNTASINTVNTALTDKLGAQSEQINSIKADYKPKYLDKNRYLSSSAQQWTYAKSVARDNYATNERITVLQSSVADNSAQVTQQLKTLTDKDSALASSVEILTTKTGQNAADISSEATARTTADTAITERVDILQSTVGANAAAINSEAVARADADKALSTRVDTVQSATSTAQAAADQAKLDATNKSAAAEQAAKDYAAAQAKAEADAAKAAASTDATTKANAAKSAAEAAAALDAKNKADAALESAKLDATQKANAAEQAATAVANAAQAAANKAAADAGNKGEVIFGSTAPVAAKRLAQNLWIDTTGGKNTPKRWNGSAWVVVTDKAATDAASAASAAQATANDALAKANANTASIATVKTEVQTLTTAQTATAQKTETLQTQLNGNTASIQQQAQSIDGLYAQWSLKVDVNGRIGGIGLAGSTELIDVAIVADRFYIAMPNEATKGKAFFTVLPTKTDINGVQVPAGAYLNGDLLATGSLSGDKITAYSTITAPNINGGQININNNFIVDSNGNVTAKSGTFEGTVLANKISGTIDVESMKRSAWTPSYKTFFSPLNSINLTPTDFISVRDYSGSHTSYGSIEMAFVGTATNAIGAIMFEIDVDVKQAVTVNQRVAIVDDSMRIFVNGGLEFQRSNSGVASFNLPVGRSRVQIIVVNNKGYDIALVLLGDFIDNNNVKFA